jgi:hypothetical protein
MNPRSTLQVPPVRWLPDVDSKSPQARHANPAAGRRNSLAGRCAEEPAGSMRVRVRVVRFIAHPGIRDALRRGEEIDVPLQAGDELLQVRVKGRQLHVLRDRSDLGGVYREDFVAAREVVRLQWSSAPLFTEVTSALAVTTDTGAGRQTETFEKRPSGPLIRLLGAAGLFTSEFVDEVSRCLQPPPLAVELTEGLQGIALEALRKPGDYFVANAGNAECFVAYSPQERELCVQYSDGQSPLLVSLCTFKLGEAGRDVIVGVDSNPAFDGQARLRLLGEFGILRPDAPAPLKAMLAADPVRDSRE